jgi:hypothetical protein
MACFTYTLVFEQFAASTLRYLHPVVFGLIATPVSAVTVYMRERPTEIVQTAITPFKFIVVA